MKNKKLSQIWEIFGTVAFTIWLVAFALSIPKLLAANDRFTLFIRIVQSTLFLYFWYTSTTQLRSRLFARKPSKNASSDTNELHN